MSNIGTLASMGVKNIAVIRAITEADDVALEVKRLKTAIISLKTGPNYADKN
jgi:thiamine monophosphate synthase